MCVSVHVQSCLTLCNPMDCSPLGSSVHGIFQSRLWSGLSFPPPGDFPVPENLHLLCLLLWQVDSLPLSHLRVPICLYI